MQFVLFVLFMVYIVKSVKILSSNDNPIYDDFLVYDNNNNNNNNDDNLGWINGDIIIESNIKKYHGLFDGDLNGLKINNDSNGISELSRTDIQLSKKGKLQMNFTLIFGCSILNITDIITVTIGTTKKIFYWVDTYDYKYENNKYPFSTSLFTINLYKNDSILYDSCYEVPGDDTVWIINNSIITDKEYDKNINIPISFKSTFDYNSPYNDDNKYWSVYDIQFTVIDYDDDNNDNNNNSSSSSIITIIAIIIVVIFLFIVIIFFIWYCKKKKKKNDENDNNGVEMGDNGMVWKYTVKGQKVTDKTQLRSAFDTPMSIQSKVVNNNNNNYNNNNYNNNNYGQQRQKNIIENHPPSLATIMGRQPSNNNNDKDSDEDSILRMQNKYASEEEQ